MHYLHFWILFTNHNYCIVNSKYRTVVDIAANQEKQTSPCCLRLYLVLVIILVYFVVSFRKLKFCLIFIFCFSQNKLEKKCAKKSNKRQKKLQKTGKKNWKKIEKNVEQNVFFKLKKVQIQDDSVPVYCPWRIASLGPCEQKIVREGGRRISAPFKL